MKYCRIVTTWCRFWSSICLCRYVSESGKCWVEQKEGWWQEERKIAYDMAQNHMWWFRQKEGFEGAGVQSVEVEEKLEDMLFWLNQKQVPQGLSRTTRLTCVTFYCNCFLCFGSFFILDLFLCFFYMSCTFCYILLDIMVLWIISIKIAYWIISIKLAYWIISI